LPSPIVPLVRWSWRGSYWCEDPVPLGG